MRKGWLRDVMAKVPEVEAVPKAGPPAPGGSPPKWINKEYTFLFAELFCKLLGSKTKAFGFSRGSWKV